MCCCLQVFLTHTPGVNSFFNMAPLDGLQWLRVFVCMAIVYGIVEIEKALVDPLLMPMIKPVLRFFEKLTPQWLSVDKPLSARLARLCGGKHLERSGSRYNMQRRGKYKKRAALAAPGGNDGGKAGSDGGQPGSNGGKPGSSVVGGASVNAPAVELVGAEQLEERRLSAVVEDRHGSLH